VEKIVLPLEVELPPHYYALYLDILSRWLEYTGLVKPKLTEASATVSAGKTGYVDFWLPKDTACIGRVFELYFPTSRGIKFGWLVDARWAVPMHYFIPNRTYVEEGIFGRYWIKWYFLRLRYEAVDAGTMTVRTWSMLIDHDDLDMLLKLAEPLVAKFGVTMPPLPVVPFSPTSSSILIRRCPACKAELLEENGKVVRVAEWGRSYSDHACTVFA